MVEAIGGVAALVLGILGLTGTIPGILAACAAMALGVALAIQGGGMAARYEEIAAVDPQTSEKIELVGGTGEEILGGVAGAVLGLLALVGIAPAILLACASIVFGAALLLGSASETSAKNYLSRAVASTPRNEQIILQSAAGAEVLAGVSPGLRASRARCVDSEPRRVLSISSSGALGRESPGR